MSKVIVFTPDENKVKTLRSEGHEVIFAPPKDYKGDLKAADPLTVIKAMKSNQKKEDYEVVAEGDFAEAAQKLGYKLSEPKEEKQEETPIDIEIYNLQKKLEIKEKEHFDEVSRIKEQHKKEIETIKAALKKAIRE